MFLYTGLAFVSAAPSIASGPITTVSIVDDAFNPEAIVVGAPNTTSGEFATIVWTNNGVLEHTVTSGDGTTGTPDGLFNSGLLSPGSTFTLQVNQTMYNSIIAKYPDGFVHYYCSIHFSIGMVGSISVSSTQVPEFSSLTLLLTFTVISVILMHTLRAKRVRSEASKTTK